MGTRSYIALQIEEDEYLTIFCHYNGYPDDNGAILAEHYDNAPGHTAQKLLRLGHGLLLPLPLFHIDTAQFQRRL